MRRAGIDPGSVRTGLAVADDEVPIATPLCTVEHHGLADAVQRVAEILQREQIAEAVVGLPLRLDGGEGEASRKARVFAEKLHAQAKIPVRLWDERLSSAAAARALAEPRYTAEPAAGSHRERRARGARPKTPRGRIDQTAATLILQSYLDSQREQLWQDPKAQSPDPQNGGHHSG